MGLSERRNAELFDHWHAVGPEPRLAGLWYAGGHGRNGILLAGLTGRLMRQLIEGEPLVEDLSRCAPERFWSW